ncbi:hypothetical protein BB560_003874 [Smittium megazygosporum]|nr:hypothetical protein BB560_003874 [Smittium megazygosporum]
MGSSSTPVTAPPKSQHLSAPPTTQFLYNPTGEPSFLSPTKHPKTNDTANRDSFGSPLVSKGVSNDILTDSSLATNKDLSFNDKFSEGNTDHSESSPNLTPFSDSISSINVDAPNAIINKGLAVNNLLSLKNGNSHQAKNLLSMIKGLMDDLESEFKEQLDQKHTKYKSLKRQLKSTISELNEARNKIFELNQTVSQLQKLCDGDSKISNSLSFINGNTDLSDRNHPQKPNSHAMSKNSGSTVHPLELVPLEQILKRLFANSENLSDNDMFKHSDSQFEEFSDKSCFDIANQYINKIKVQLSGGGNSQSMAAVLQNFINQLSIRHSNLLEFSMDLSSQQHLKQEKYAKTLSNLLQLSETNIDSWINSVCELISEKLASFGHSSNVSFLSPEFSEEVHAKVASLSHNSDKTDSMYSSVSPDNSSASKSDSKSNLFGLLNYKDKKEQPSVPES